MFHGLTERAQRVLTEEAQSIARRSSVVYLQPEHLMLALTHVKDALGSISMRRAGIKMKSAANRYFARHGVDERALLQSLDDPRVRWDYDTLAPDEESPRE